MSPTGRSREAKLLAQKLRSQDRRIANLARTRQLMTSDVPVTIDGEQVNVTLPDLMQDSATAVIDLDVVKVDLALNEAATIAAGQAAAAAKQQAEQLEGDLTPVKDQWEEFYGTGGKTLEEVLTDIQAAQASADGAIRTHYGPNPPWANGTTQPDSVQGDMWLDTDDAIAYRWIGTTWELIPDAGVAKALAEARAAALAAAQAQQDADAAAGVAEAAQTLAGDTASDLLELAGKTGRLIRSTTAPTGDDKNANNLWLNTSTGQLHELVGTTWTVITDSRLTTVINRADAAWNLADGAAEAAGNAESLANAAQTAANNANTAAGEAAAAALAAQGAAEAAQSTASSAASAAQAAQGTADAAAQAALDAAGIAAAGGRVWAEPIAPPSGTTYEWVGTPGASESVARVNGVETRRNLVPAPAGPGESTPATGWWRAATTDLSVVEDEGQQVIQARENAAESSFYADPNVNFSPPEGHKIRVSLDLKTNNAVVAAGMRVRLPNYGGAETDPAYSVLEQSIPVDEWVRLSLTAESAAMPDGGYLRAIAWPSGNAPDTDTWLRIRNAIVETGIELPADSFFDGDTPDDRANDLWINTLDGANTPHTWDSTIHDWVEVTDAVAKQAALDVIAAQQRADDAFDNAATANDRAAALEGEMLLRISEIGTLTGSVSTASGKYTVAASNPTASDAAGKALNSVWEVRSGSTTLRRYVLTGPTTWTQVAIGRDMVGVDAIGNAQIGNLAVGTAELADAAVTNLKFGDAHGGKLWAKSVTMDKAIFEPANLFPDPLILDGGDAASGIPAGWPSTGNAKRVVDLASPGGYSLEITSTTGQVGSYYRSTAYVVPLEAGEKYRVRALVEVTGTAAQRLMLYQRVMKEDGTSTTASAELVPADAPASAAGTKQWFETTLTASPIGVGPSAIGIYTISPYVAGRTFKVTDVHLVPMVGGTMITPEGIFANHLHASVGEDLVLTGNAVIIETQGAASGAQTTATQALEALAPLSEVPGLIEDLDADVTEAQRLANLGIGDAEAADKKAADAIKNASDVKLVADKAADDIREQKKRFSFGEDGLVITDEGYSSAITIDNDGITMSQNGNPVSSWIGGTFSADIVEADVFRVGMHQWQKYPLEEGATVTGTVIKTVVIP